MEKGGAEKAWVKRAALSKEAGNDPKQRKLFGFQQSFNTFTVNYNF